MMDAVTLESKEIIALGDFNMDLLKVQKHWNQTISLFNLHQLIYSPTRVAPHSETLIDHVYVSDKNNVLEACVPVFNCSDHYPICVTWSKKGVKIPKPGHKTITYRCFTNFHEHDFLCDLTNSNLSSVFNIRDPDQALEVWIQTFTHIYDKHAPLKTIRVRHVHKPPWYTKELQEAGYLRDLLKKHGYEEESKILRNAINSQAQREKAILSKSHIFKSEAQTSLASN